MKKPYSIAIDLGTNSVGWCLITDDYKVPAKRLPVMGNTGKTHIKKNLMGVLLFDEGQVAAERRMKRVFRRRLTRRRNRLRYLQEIFAEPMQQVDETFFHRLDDTFLRVEDKQWHKYPIFGTLAEELAYHETFPTIYHLRQHLADSPEKADLRLVYLALAHIIKFRGHFLHEGKLTSEHTDVQPLFEQFLEVFDGLRGTGLSRQPLMVKDILTAKLSKSKKVEQVLALTQGLDKETKAALKQFLNLTVGLQANFTSIFSLPEDVKLQLSKDSYEDDLQGLLTQLGDSRYEELFQVVKQLSDAIVLSGILTTNEATHAKLSAVMVKRYQDHKDDLQKLKDCLKETSRDLYREVFSAKSKTGYTAYIEQGLSQDAFYKYLKGILKAVEGREYFLEKIEQDNFLRKQRTFDNGSIPHQLHLEELRAILNRQGKHYPFLEENKAKIEQILTFRIPYYVGPLANGQSQFAWLSRKSDDKIRPWNFDEIVDKEASATAFIDKLTNRDTYLPDEKVLPKHSLLYQEFTVYNELTKIRYEAEGQEKPRFFGANMKQEIVDHVFKEHRKVTQKVLMAHLDNEFPQFRITGLIGLDNEKGAFNASLSTYHDLKKILGRDFLDQPDNQEVLEELVHTLTVFEDKEMIKQRLSQHFSGTILKQLARRHYTGWGRLSRKLIHGLRDAHSRKTILDYLIDDGYSNRNFMQLINDDGLSFKKYIADAQEQHDSEDIKQVIADLPGSPAIKKGIWQSIKIVDELVKVMGYAPEHIIIEMARENQTTARGRKNAQERLKRLEEALGGLGSAILKEKKPDYIEGDVQNHHLQNDALYLYYLQNGTDMYTGDALDVNKLPDYDIDHIIPRSFIKDDSLDNRVLTISKENRKKLDNVPSMEVVAKMRPFWEQLYRSRLISKRKYDNLTKASRGGLTEEDKARFIKRQLVETRQITKHVARLLDERFNPTVLDGKRQRTVQVLTLKASLTSQFRELFGLHKVREINDYHHAHDAYLNAVIGKALLTRYPQLAPEFVYGEYHVRKRSITDAKATEKTFFYSNLMNMFQETIRLSNDVIIERPMVEINEETGEIAWNKKKHMATVKKVLSYPQVNIVKKTEIQSGRFTKETVLPKGDSDKLIARKTKEVYLDPKKYGGVDSPTVAYAVLVVASVEKGKAKKLKQVKDLVGVTIMERQQFEKDPIAFLEAKGYRQIQNHHMIKLPKYSLFEFENGRRRLLASSGELQKGNQLVLPHHLVTLLYHAQRVDGKNAGDHLTYLKEHRALFDELFEMIVANAQRFVSKPKAVESLIEQFTQKKETSDLKELAKSFLELLKFTAYGAPAELKFLGKTIPRQRYMTVTECLSAILVHQSVTGLYETRIDLSKLGDD
ncbi:type II CRISPR RNA-guided endonuclease Cas9 [Streptococcus ovuberis]|uniref:CRISPR-associated endonuclease Cas9 n=1 Tax=Streptococcus ovuberis TaxID=1936207 RepID=A0A7X6MZ61_9STRE|nr:type II CRISPR RNA-guided endonuclease Cas9 [Streptococcus ovuberis]